MEEVSMMRSRLAFCATLLGLALVVPALQADDKPARPSVDVVICLDVSGSMNGLMDSARMKLWDIVNDLGKAKPAPILRVGLYSYGHTSYDPAKGWVRKEADLTTDLDEVYKKLNGLTIRGGIEYVARVCRDAIVEQKWSEDKKALKMIFVCGNEPVDQDKEVHLKDVAQMALQKDIIINTIYCTRPRFAAEGKGWQDFAKMAEGSYAAIDQKAGTVAVAAPQDKKLAELSTKLNSTYVAYGKQEVRQEKAQNQSVQDANAGRLAPAAAATRAIAKGGAHYRNSDWDLVDRLRDDPKLDITKIPEAELCDELKKLKPEERVAFVKKKQEERFAIQKEIVELSKQRDDYVREETKKNAKAGQQVFDEAVRGALRDQANRKGIKIPE
jgi:hypothetical protein